ncbi:MAG: DUF3159 domain-containing protein [Rhodoluna sp.]
MTSNKSQNHAARLGLQNENGEINISRQSVTSALGGVFGIVESIVPSLAFVTVLALTSNTPFAVGVAVSLSAVFLIVQLIRRKPITQALAGAIGIAISAFLPLREGGKASDYFLQGFFTNGAYLSALAVSLIVRWPLVGVLVGLLIGKGKTWRSNKPQYRRFQAATLVWVLLFAGRLLVQVPLYLANQTEVLGLMRVFMGVPLYALCIWFTWLLVRPVVQAQR